MKGLVQRVWIAGLAAAWMAIVPGSAHSAVPAGDAGVTLGWEDNGSSVDLPGIRWLEVRLPSIPSTGYEWMVEDLDAAYLTAFGEPAFETSGGVGGEAVEVLRYRPEHAGTTSLALAYRRAWEADTEPLSRFSVAVTISDPIGEFALPAQPMALAAPETAYQPNPSLGLPTSYDWCALGGCTPVRNQGGCGSCWAFATVGAMESALKISSGVDQNLSEQYLVSCNDSGYSCGGGWFAHGYHISSKRAAEPEAGAVLESEFPYTATNSACNSPHTHVARLASWSYISGYGVPAVDDIKTAIQTHGPVAVAVCVGSNYYAYRTGVMQTGDSCGSSSVNHAVVLVGWDDNALGSGVGAWKLRNSWGAGWGMAGYMWIKYGISMVGYGANYVVGETAPGTPLSLHVTDSTWGTVGLAWTDNAGNERSFTVERSPDGSGSWSPMATLSANSVAYNDYGAICESDLYYRVRATNLWGDSSYSNTVSATTGTCPVWSDWLFLPFVN